MSKKPTIIVRKAGATIVKPLAVSVTVKEPARALQPVPARDSDRAEGRINGGVIDFVPGIDLMYSVSFRRQHAYLDAVALARKATAGKPSSGPHRMEFDSAGQELWVDGRCLLVLGAENVALLGDADGQLRVVGTDRIDDALNEPEPTGPSIVAQGLTVWHERRMTRLDQLLRQSARVRSFLDSPNA